MADAPVGPVRVARAVVWSAAGVAMALVVAIGLFVLSQVSRALGESYCSADSRVPADAGGAGGPTFVDPVHLRCDYGPAGSQVFTDVGPLLEALAVGLAVVLAVGIVGWCARVLTVAIGPGVRKS